MMAWLWLALACSGPAPAPAVEAPPAWGAEKLTQSGQYFVSLEMTPAPPGMGELFRVSATLKDKDRVPIEDAQVVLAARMPQHNHGMETDPIADPGLCPSAPADPGAPAVRCTHASGVYSYDGFKFHMGGEWTITVDVAGPRGPDSTSFVYDMR